MPEPGDGSGRRGGDERPAARPAAGPEVDREAIERRVDEILTRVPDYVWDGEELPVPVELIVDTVYGLRVRDVDDLSTAPGAPEVPSGGLSGLLLTAPGEIWVNAAESRRWPPRRRFTIGHELGHWVMHRSGQQHLFCRTAEIESEPSDPAGRRQLSLPTDSAAEAGRRGPVFAPAAPPLPPIELEANAFAAALMMPEHLMRERHADFDGDARRLQEAFGSSEKATLRRIETLFGEPPA